MDNGGPRPRCGAPAWSPPTPLAEGCREGLACSPARPLCSGRCHSRLRLSGKPQAEGHRWCQMAGHGWEVPVAGWPGSRGHHALCPCHGLMLHLHVHAIQAAPDVETESQRGCGIGPGRDTGINPEATSAMSEPPGLLTGVCWLPSTLLLHPRQLLLISPAQTLRPGQGKAIQ